MYMNFFVCSTAAARRHEFVRSFVASYLLLAAAVVVVVVVVFVIRRYVEGKEIGTHWKIIIKGGPGIVIDIVKYGRRVALSTRHAAAITAGVLESQSGMAAHRIQKYNRVKWDVEIPSSTWCVWEMVTTVFSSIVAYRLGRFCFGCEGTWNAEADSWRRVWWLRIHWKIAVGECFENLWIKDFDFE